MAHDDYEARLREIFERMVRLETQMGLFVSRFESEQGTRSRESTRVHEELSSLEERLDFRMDKVDVRMSKFEKIVYIGLGMVLASQWFLHAFGNLIFHK